MTTAVRFETTGHPGWDAVRFAHRLLMIDEPWTERLDDGFTWCDHRLAQRYRWEGPIDVDGLPTWFLAVDTDVLRGVDDHHALSRSLAALESASSRLGRRARRDVANGVNRRPEG